jgi:hypothetical protein
MHAVQVVISPPSMNRARLPWTWSVSGKGYGFARCTTSRHFIPTSKKNIFMARLWLLLLHYYCYIRTPKRRKKNKQKGETRTAFFQGGAWDTKHSLFSLSRKPGLDVYIQNCAKKKKLSIYGT